jgi:hypothetical protein
MGTLKEGLKKLTMVLTGTAITIGVKELIGVTTTKADNPTMISTSSTIKATATTFGRMKIIKRL